MLISRLAAALRRSARPSGMERGVLAEVADRLTSLSSETEGEFLRVGARLQDFVTVARDQRAGIADLLEALGTATGDELSAALEEVAGWSHGSGEAASLEARLHSLAPVIRAVRGPAEALRGAVRALRFTGVLTRVESARLGANAAGFDALAAEVAAVADAIDTRSASILEAEAAIGELLARTEASVAGTASRQSRSRALLASECSRGLDELRDASRRGAAVARDTGARYEAFSSRIGDLVAALQSHDSARQSLEHIAEALRESAETASAPLAELQCVQLDRARRSFTGAVADILSDLDRLADAVGDCACMTRELMDVRQGSRRGWIADLESRFEAIAAGVAEDDSSRCTIAAAANEVQASCLRMGGFVSEIRSLGERMLRLALNAQIQAVHLASAGVVMEAVAEAIRGTSEASSESAGAAAGALDEVDRAARALAVLLDGSAGRAGRSDSAGRIRRAASALKAAEERAANMLAAIVTASEELSADIAALRQSIAAARVFDETAGECIERIRASVRWVRDPRSSSAVGLADAAAGYTMHAEREAHAAFMQDAGLRGQEAAALPAAGPDPTGLGDNVELF